METPYNKCILELDVLSFFANPNIINVYPMPHLQPYVNLFRAAGGMNMLRECNVVDAAKLDTANTAFYHIEFPEVNEYVITNNFGLKYIEDLFTAETPDEVPRLCGPVIISNYVPGTAINCGTANHIYAENCGAYERAMIHCNDQSALNNTQRAFGICNQKFSA